MARENLYLVTGDLNCEKSFRMNCGSRARDESALYRAVLNILKRKNINNVENLRINYIGKSLEEMLI